MSANILPTLSYQKLDSLIRTVNADGATHQGGLTYHHHTLPQLEVLQQLKAIVEVTEDRLHALQL